MKRRQERISSLIRNVVGQLLLSKISDPRIDPARVSITHVEVSEDLMTARIFISVIGEPKDQKLAVRALQHAGGHIQDLMMRQISLRFTPHLEFVEDEKFKKTLETYQLIQKAMTELREKEEAQQEGPSGEQSAENPSEPTAPEQASPETPDRDSQE